MATKKTVAFGFVAREARCEESELGAGFEIQVEWLVESIPYFLAEKTGLRLPSVEFDYSRVFASKFEIVARFVHTHF